MEFPIHFLGFGNPVVEFLEIVIRQPNHEVLKLIVGSGLPVLFPCAQKADELDGPIHPVHDRLRVNVHIGRISRSRGTVESVSSIKG